MTKINNNDNISSEKRDEPMNHIEELVEEIYDDKKIELSKLFSFDLSEEEYEELIARLKELKVEIIEDEAYSECLKFDSTDPVHEYLKEISSYPLLTADEEKKLFELYKNGDEGARKKLINSNLRLVVYAVKRVHKEYIGNQKVSLNFLDLIQEGNIGLIKAIDKFDLSKGMRLSTYALWWIKQCIQRAIFDTGSLIRIPDNTGMKANRIIRYKYLYMIENGKEPSIDDYVKEFGYTVEQINRCLDLEYSLVSLQEPVKADEEGSALIETFVPDKHDYVEELVNKLYSEELWTKIKSILSEREYDILVKRMGKYAGDVYTLNRIGKEYNLTRERIRSLEHNALEKIKIKRKSLFRGIDYN